MGRWWAIDPALQASSPYMAMGNNPMMMVDEDGEWFFKALTYGALFFAGGGYTADVAFSDDGLKNWRFSEFFKSKVIEGLSASLTYGIGNVFGGIGGSAMNSTGAQVLNEAGRAATHGMVQGGLNLAQGGSFQHGFASGSIASLGGSAFHEFGGNFAKSAVGITAFGALSGGIGAELSGGNFGTGAGQGAMVSLLNHYMHQPESGKNKKSEKVFPEKKDSPIFELEFKLKFGLGYEEELYFLGIGEKAKASITVDYMTFKISEKGIKYIPFQDINLTGEYGVPLLNLNANYSLFSGRFNPGAQVGLVELSRYGSPRLNIFSAGYLFGGGFNSKLSIDFYKAANSLIKVHNQYEKSIGSYPRAY